jgi:hypothetical protein
MQYAWAIENTNLIYLLCPNQMQYAWAIENTNLIYLLCPNQMQCAWAIENTNLICLLCPNQMQYAWAIENTNLIYLLCPNQMQYAWAIENTNIGYFTYTKMQTHIKNASYSNPRYAKLSRLGNRTTSTQSFEDISMLSSTIRMTSKRKETSNSITPHRARTSPIYSRNPFQPHTTAS